MPRVARSIIPDIPYHVIHRGNNRQKIFFSDYGYGYFLSLMKEAKEKYPCRIYSYVLMPNHVHMLLESFKSPENLAKFIKLVAQKYSQYINRAYKRSGTLWEGRFKSSPVSKDSYLLACMRYIELNPVRAKIVKEPGAYKWGSYRFKIGDKDTHLLLDEDPIYSDFGKEKTERQINYKNWVKESIPQGEWEVIRKTINKGCVFGNIDFRKKMEDLLERNFGIRERGRPAKNKK